MWCYKMLKIPNIADMKRSKSFSHGSPESNTNSHFKLLIQPHIQKNIISYPSEKFQNSWNFRSIFLDLTELDTALSALLMTANFHFIFLVWWSWNEIKLIHSCSVWCWFYINFVTLWKDWHVENQFRDRPHRLKLCLSFCYIYLDRHLS